MKLQIAALVVSIVFLQGCAALTQPYAFSQRPAEQVELFSAVDRAVARAKVQNAHNIDVKGYPYMRTNRFLIGVKDSLYTADQVEAWLKAMVALSVEDRTKEIYNLPQDDFETLAARLAIEPRREVLIDVLAQGSWEMLSYDMDQQGFLDDVRKRVEDPTEYSTFMRIIGLYPLFAVPVVRATIKAYNKFYEWHDKSPDEFEVLGKLKIFSAQGQIAAEKGKAIIQSAPKDKFGRYILSEKQERDLALAFAPVYQQDVKADYDRFGQVQWVDDEVKINTNKPTSYYFTSHVLVKDKPALQMNYVNWYEGRLGPDSPWLERGLLDGMTYRVTFDSEGDPIMVDITNNCGCYHMFVPSREKIGSVITGKDKVDPFVPIWLPESFPDEKMNLRINTGWHQVQSIFTNDSEGDLTYKLERYEVLEMLPKDDGYESVFNRHGIMKDSTRIEHYVFFPTGIAKVGFMRQRGNQPTKLVDGKAHFTDANIFNENFIFR